MASSCCALVSLVTMSVVLAGGGLVAIMAARLARSILNCGLLVAAIRRLMPELEVRAVLSLSGYAYLNRVAAVTYQNADKPVIGSLSDMRAVALFSVPFLLANRVFGMVYRLGHALFPLASALASQRKQAQLRATYLLATRYLVYLNACLCVTLCVLSRELLYYWAGHEFGPPPALVLTLVALAVFIDSLTNLPSLVNNGFGQPVNTGVFAVARAILGVILVFVLVKRYGLIGAAWGQLLTSSVMTIAFVNYIHGRTVPVPFATTARQAYLPALLVLALFLPIALLRTEATPASLPAGAALTCAVATVLTLVGWRWCCGMKRE